MGPSSQGWWPHPVQEREGEAASTSALVLKSKEASYYTAAVLKTNSTSCSRTLDINNLKQEGPGPGPREQTDQKWEAGVGHAQPALAASAAQPS